MSVVNENFEFKLYLDCVVYYAFIVCLVVAATACHAHSGLRGVAHRRVRVPLPLSTDFHPFPYGVAVGELAVIASVSGLYAFWLWFWTAGYSRGSIQ